MQIIIPKYVHMVAVSHSLFRIPQSLRLQFRVVKKKLRIMSVYQSAVFSFNKSVYLDIC